jgi:hypothetical protein
MKKTFLFLVLILLPGLAPAKQKFAVIIGIDDYQSKQINPLRYSIADAKYLQDALLRFGRFKKENVHTLLGAEATGSEIENEIYWLGEMAKPEDTVVFYFSGHGTRVVDTDGNEEDGMDEAFCPWDTNLGRENTVIVDDELGYWFRRIKSKEVIVILDCCFSGGAAGRGLENDGGKGITMSQPGARGQMTGSKELDPYSYDLSLDNKIIISASAADQQSYEDVKLQHGIFTYFICEGIRGSADTNQDQDVTTGEIYDYTNNRTLEFARGLMKQQTPQKFGTLNNAIVVELNKQIADLLYFDRDLRTVLINVGGKMVKKGDKYVIRKSYQMHGRDLTIGDKDIFVVEVTTVQENESEATIIQEFYPGISLDASTLPEYYAERVNYGSISLNTQPWSTVFIDGKEIGPTPLVIRDVSEGEHKLEFRVVFEGYPSTVEKKIVVEANKTVRMVEKFAKK